MFLKARERKERNAVNSEAAVYVGKLDRDENTYLVCANNTTYPIKPTVIILNSHALDFLRHSVFFRIKRRNQNKIHAGGKL